MTGSLGFGVSDSAVSVVMGEAARFLWLCGGKAVNRCCTMSDLEVLCCAGAFCAHDFLLGRSVGRCNGAVLSYEDPHDLIIGFLDKLFQYGRRGTFDVVVWLLRLGLMIG